ncbi:MAG: hypothetical protein HY820_04450 [Acidobacteria bacterium]|nr:hypothetical protein [Acidobacteriota bacterium]
MSTAVYVLCSFTTLSCAVFLLQAYARVRRPLLLWSGLCFLGLGISNILVFIDLVVYRDVDLFQWRLITAALAMAVLLYGLIWEDR